VPKCGDAVVSWMSAAWCRQRRCRATSTSSSVNAMSPINWSAAATNIVDVTKKNKRMRCVDACKIELTTVYRDDKQNLCVNGPGNILRKYFDYTCLFHRRTRKAYLYNGCLAW